MTTHEGRVRQLEVTVRFIAAAVLVVGLVAAVFSRVAFCAASPPGSHRVASLGDVVGLLPPLAVLIVGGYLALRLRRHRMPALALVLVAAAAVEICALTMFPLPSCGL